MEERPGERSSARASFSAGTTTVVAEVIQGSLECTSLGLKVALKAALT